MMQAWIAGLPQKTGRSLDDWIELVQDEGPRTEKERRAWLKAEHGLGTNAAWWIAERAEGKGTADGDPEAYLKAAEGYVDAMFGGKKSGLKPIYEIMEGWNCSTRGARSWADLPARAVKYVRRIEELIGAPVAMLSTSPEREDTILVRDPFLG